MLLSRVTPPEDYEGQSRGVLARTLKFHACGFPFRLDL
jgi:hypothetical protein